MDIAIDLDKSPPNAVRTKLTTDLVNVRLKFSGLITVMDAEDLAPAKKSIRSFDLRDATFGPYLTLEKLLNCTTGSAPSESLNPYIECLFLPDFYNTNDLIDAIPILEKLSCLRFLYIPPSVNLAVAKMSINRIKTIEGYSFNSTCGSIFTFQGIIFRINPFAGNNISLDNAANRNGITIDHDEAITVAGKSAKLTGQPILYKEECNSITDFVFNNSSVMTKGMPVSAAIDLILYPPNRKDQILELPTNLVSITENAIKDNPHINYITVPYYTTTNGSIINCKNFKGVNRIKQEMDENNNKATTRINLPKNEFLQASQLSKISKATAKNNKKAKRNAALMRKQEKSKLKNEEMEKKRNKRKEIKNDKGTTTTQSRNTNLKERWLRYPFSLSSLYMATGALIGGVLVYLLCQYFDMFTDKAAFICGLVFMLFPGFAVICLFKCDGWRQFLIQISMLIIFIGFFILIVANRYTSIATGWKWSAYMRIPHVVSFFLSTFAGFIGSNKYRTIYISLVHLIVILGGYGIYAYFCSIYAKDIPLGQLYGISVVETILLEIIFAVSGFLNFPAALLIAISALPIQYLYSLVAPLVILSFACGLCHIKCN